MERHIAEILEIIPVTHDVRSYRIRKPEGYSFKPGQATEVAINKPGWQNEKRPFTFTSLNTDPYLEFTIKSYPRAGVTEQLMSLKKGDELIIHDVWGAIEYKGAGTFIAGGAGITPFIAILRDLKKKGKTAGNSLLFSNKTKGDIILENELKDILGNNADFILTNEPSEGYHFGIINKEYLSEKIGTKTDQHFYVCGPDPMVAAISENLEELGAKTEEIIFEK